MILQLRSSRIPTGVRGPTLFDPSGLPRYWPTVWAAFLPGDLAETTVTTKLRYVESLYSFADDLCGPGSFDNALAMHDIEAIGQVLEGYFFALKNRATASTSAEKRWQTALEFSKEVLTRITKAADTEARLHDLTGC